MPCVWLRLLRTIGWLPARAAVLVCVLVLSLSLLAARSFAPLVPASPAARRLLFRTCGARVAACLSSLVKATAPLASERLDAH